MDSSVNPTHPSQARHRVVSRSKATAGGPRKARPRRAEAHSRPTPETPTLPLEFESFERLYNTARREVRTILHDEPLVALGGAFAAGFILGGGWRTRVGKAMMLAGGRYVVVQAARRYL